MNTMSHTWIELNADAFNHNIQQFKNLLGQQTQIGVVIKSNAYGHGINQISDLCQKNPHVAWLFTTTLEEAVHIRSIGVDKPMLALSLVADPKPAIEHNISVMAYSNSSLQRLNARAQEWGKPLSVHIKIDTGMSRFGAYNSDAVQLIEYAQQLPYLRVEGIYTHFAESDAQNQEFTLQQLRQFQDVLDALNKKNIHIPMVHASNSAATLTLHDARFNVVRIGAGAYGMWPSPSTQQKIQKHHAGFSLIPVLTWKTKLIDIRTIPAQCFVGYGRTHQTRETSKIGLLPIGYYEGYDRRLSNKGIVGIPQADSTIIYAPVLGRVCMNVIMIDLTQVPHAAIGDKIILLGAPEQIQATALAQKMESYNPREVTTRLHPDIPRIVI